MRWYYRVGFVEPWSARGCHNVFRGCNIPILRYTQPLLFNGLVTAHSFQLNEASSFFGRQAAHQELSGLIVVVLAVFFGKDEACAGGCGHGLICAFDGAPDHLVEEQIVSGIFAGEVHFAGKVAAPGCF
jgi:hypothetical protein